MLLSFNFFSYLSAEMKFDIPRDQAHLFPDFFDGLDDARDVPYSLPLLPSLLSVLY